MSKVVGSCCAVSEYEYRCHVHWAAGRYSVCVCDGVSVCEGRGPNGETMAHQLLFDCRGGGTMSVARQHGFSLAPKPSLSESVRGGRMKRR